MEDAPKWTEAYLREMKKRDVPPEWQEAAEYHLKWIHHKPVKEIRIINWYPRHIDLDARIVDEADIWCSARVDGRSYGVMVEMAGEDIGYTFFPGTPGKSGPPPK